MKRSRRREQAGDARSVWMVAVEAFVADVSDPERMHRIRVVIPSIDETFVHDEWVTALVPWVGPDGYGPVNLPEVGSEVILFGRLGQKHTLYYLSRYNEKHHVPGGFVNTARGQRNDKELKLLSDEIISIISEMQVSIQAESEIGLDAEDVWIRGKGAASLHARGNKIAVLGAEPAGRQQLPTDAHDLDSCVALCNALKHLVAIRFGFAE